MEYQRATNLDSPEIYKNHDAYAGEQIIMAKEKEEILVDCVEVKALVPKAFVEELKKQAWFKYYSGMGSFIAEAMRRLKDYWEKTP